MRGTKLLFGVCFFLSAAVCVAVAAEMFNVPMIEQPDLSKLKPMPVVKTMNNNAVVVIHDGNEVTIQLIGVDIPIAAKVINCAEQAGRFVGNLLKGESVYIVTDTKQKQADSNSGIAAYIYRVPDGLFVNAEIIRQGYGLVSMKSIFRYMKEFHQLELFARQSEKGIWAAGAVLPVKQNEQTSQPVPVAAAVVKDDDRAKELNSDDIIVYVTKSGKKYHGQGCRFLSKSSIPLKLKEAKEKYSPCSVCRPPE